MTAEERAEKLHESLCYQPPERWSEIIVAAIRDAVAAERERCERIANAVCVEQGEAWNSQHPEFGHGARVAADIAARIREGAPQ